MGTLRRGICEYCHRTRPLVQFRPQACDGCSTKAIRHEPTKPGPYPKTMITVGRFSVPPRCSQCLVWTTAVTTLPQVNDAGDFIGQLFYCDACYELMKQIDPVQTTKATISLLPWVQGRGW